MNCHTKSTGCLACIQLKFLLLQLFFFAAGSRQGAFTQCTEIHHRHWRSVHLLIFL